MDAKRKSVIGILAHVDAGKTTLSESILYLSGKLRQQGRVDHGDAFLDTNDLEKSRGITIFSSQAVFTVGDMEVTLLDTPGHVDFSSEMERTLQVLDYAILVINGADGVQGHTRTLWNLLKHYQIPVFLFINKMDQQGTDEARLLEELRTTLDEGCIKFENEKSEEFYEEIAMTDDHVLELFMENGEVEDEIIRRLIRGRKVFPCYFGSALRNKGVEELLQGIVDYTEEAETAEAEFGAKVFKITRDSQGNRLTHMKITGGLLKVKDLLNNKRFDEDYVEEKVNQIRIYSGEKFEAVQEAACGTVCAVTGLTFTYPGEGIGVEEDSHMPVLEPVLNYRIDLPEGCDTHTMLRNFRLLEEEDPMLRIVWDEENAEIHVQLMGEVQIEILQSLIKKRFGIDVSFDKGNIVYKETIADTVEGVGHFEPLRHYAEVHLLMEPGEPGSGIVLGTACSEDMLDKNWQRLILTHLMEKEYRGVLTGAAITDMKITLISGRAHIKHTEGGDFRQATYRAVRQGLMQAQSVLLEPFYDFRMELPAECVGRAITDIQRMNGEFEPPLQEGDLAVITGSGPVSELRDYQIEITTYTKGRGKMFCTLKGYRPCKNAEAVIEEKGYDPNADVNDPTGSVFCAHGAGYFVPWDQVYAHMHIERLQDKMRRQMEAKTRAVNSKPAGVPLSSLTVEEEKELEEIFIRTYGKVERKTPTASKRDFTSTTGTVKRAYEDIPEFLLVDGYNVIFAWDDLKELARENIEAARNKLMDILCNYQGYKKCNLILVYDAYKVQGDVLEIQKYHNIHVVYTKEAETADQYIEKVVHEIGRKYHVTVVTSDGLEQVITLGQGGTLISSREFLEEVKAVSREIQEECEKRRVKDKNYLFNHMDKELADHMENIRLGKVKDTE